MSDSTQWILERVGNLDLSLPQKFGRRSLVRALSYASQFKEIYGPRGPNNGRVVVRGPCVVGGLEVQWAFSGSSVHVLDGLALCTRPAVPGSPTPGPPATPTSFPPSETRPGTWSGKDEEDFDTFELCELPAQTAVAPATPIASALTNFEWWLIYAEPVYPCLEIDSNRKVWVQEGPLAGTFQPATDGYKVRGHRLELHSLRGSPGIPPVAAPTSTALPLAWIYVPTGSTDLSTCVIYDVRRMAELDQQPNEIGGHWQANPDTSGTETTQRQTVMTGTVSARLQGERLEASSRLAVTVAQIAEPGAVWDVTASTSAPKIAWLYLTKVLGVVPRPTRRGLDQIGLNVSFPDDAEVVVNGGLVLSATPPRNSDAFGKRDMRASADIILSSWVSAGGIPYGYSGIVANKDDCICVGFIRYTALSASLPVPFGVLKVGRDGWCSGGAIDSTKGPGGAVIAPDSTGRLAGSGLDPTDLVTLTAGQIDPASGKSTRVEAKAAFTVNAFGLQPFTAVQVLLSSDASGTTGPHQIIGQGALAAYDDPQAAESVATAPAVFAMPFDFGLIEAESACFTAGTQNARLKAVQLPYGIPLVT